MLYECWVKNHIVFKEKGREEKEHPRVGHHCGPRILPQKHFLTLSIFHRQVESKSICCCGRGCVGIVERFENWPSGYVDFITPKSFTSWMTTVSLSFLSSKISDWLDDFEGLFQIEDCESLQVLEILYLTTCDVYIKNESVSFICWFIHLIIHLSLPYCT